MPFTGGLLPLENLTMVTVPSPISNSACTAAALRVTRALLSPRGLKNGSSEHLIAIELSLAYASSQLCKGRFEKRKAERANMPKLVVRKESVCFPSSNLRRHSPIQARNNARGIKIMPAFSV
jgi:hypothetical protein